VDTDRKADTVSHMDDESKTISRRPRRSFTDEFRAGATRSALRNWVEQARADRTKSKSGGLTTAEREELGKLRKQVRELTMERDTLKEAAAYFAKHQR
jgi:transposase